MIVVDNGNSTDSVAGATYGGLSLIDGGAQGGDLVFSHKEGAEDACVNVFYLGRNVPAGEQEVKCTGAAEDIHVICITIDGPSEDSRLEGFKTLDSAGTANPSVTCETGDGNSLLVFGVLHSGQEALASVTPAAGYTQIASNDFGAAVDSIIVKDALSPGGNIAVGWTATSDEAGVVAFAIGPERDFGDGNFSVLPSVGVGPGDRVIVQVSSAAGVYWELLFTPNMSGLVTYP